MENDSINSFIDALYAAGISGVEMERIRYTHCGHLVMPLGRRLGFIGGDLTQLTTDQYGRILFKNMVVSPLLGCGHVSTSIKQVGGICFVCKQLICDKCLRICDLTGVSVCRRHSIIKRGLVISHHARKGLWRLKAYREAKKREEIGFNARKQISYNK